MKQDPHMKPINIMPHCKKGFRSGDLEQGIFFHPWLRQYWLRGK